MADFHINEFCDRACRDLPRGWQLSIDLEKDAGTVGLIDWDGNDVEIPRGDGETIYDQVEWCIAYAIQTEKELSAAKERSNG